MGLAERVGPVGRACGAAVTNLDDLELRRGRTIEPSGYERVVCAPARCACPFTL